MEVLAIKVIFCKGTVMVNRLGSCPSVYKFESYLLQHPKMFKNYKISNSLLSSAPTGLTRFLLLRISRFKSLMPINLSRWNKNYLFALVDSHIIHYPTPISLTYAWSFGSLAGICLVIQMISGIFLAMHYTPHIDLAFSSVEHIMRDVKNGWLIRYIHANGASMFFIVVYCHICRGLYYGSYMEPRQLLWCSGVILFLLMMGTAFTGYVLPWGQMSFWGATVITSMVTAIPIAGQPIVQWLWGGYTVGNPTLNRFFSLHFLLPFLIAGITLIHLILLHKEGSNSPIGSDTGVDDVPFYPYFFSKDVFALFCFFVFYYPNTLNHPDNYIPADPLQTPAHVVPEWYFLPFYAILRSIPHKAGGIIAMVGAILVLLLIPYINTSDVRNTTYRPIFKICFWLFIADFIILTWVGQKPVRDTFILVGQIGTVYYFAFFTILIPVVGAIESKLVHYKSSN
jgi:ubiquinol-cytochrome c reductase cytochrome b subunit